MQNQTRVGTAGRALWLSPCGDHLGFALGAKFYITDGDPYLPPRYVFSSAKGAYWSRPDRLRPSDVAVSSIINPCNYNGCSDPTQSGYCPNPWPTSGVRGYALTDMTPSPPLVKPPNFVGPLHLEAQ